MRNGRSRSQFLCPRAQAVIRCDYTYACIRKCLIVDETIIIIADHRTTCAQ